MLAAGNPRSSAMNSSRSTWSPWGRPQGLDQILDNLERERGRLFMPLPPGVRDEVRQFIDLVRHREKRQIISLSRELSHLGKLDNATKKFGVLWHVFKEGGKKKEDAARYGRALRNANPTARLSLKSGGPNRMQEQRERSANPAASGGQPLSLNKTEEQFAELLIDLRVRSLTYAKLWFLMADEERKAPLRSRRKRMKDPTARAEAGRQARVLRRVKKQFSGVARSCVKVGLLDSHPDHGSFINALQADLLSESREKLLDLSRRRRKKPQGRRAAAPVE